MVLTLSKLTKTTSPAYKTMGVIFSLSNCFIFYFQCYVASIAIYNCRNVADVIKKMASVLLWQSFSLSLPVLQS